VLLVVWRARGTWVVLAGLAGLVVRGVVSARCGHATVSGGLRRRRGGGRGGTGPTSAQRSWMRRAEGRPGDPPAGPGPDRAYGRQAVVLHRDVVWPVVGVVWPLGWALVHRWAEARGWAQMWGEAGVRGASWVQGWSRGYWTVGFQTRVESQVWSLTQGPCQCQWPLRLRVSTYLYGRDGPQGAAYPQGGRWVAGWGQPYACVLCRRTPYPSSGDGTVLGEAGQPCP